MIAILLLFMLLSITSITVTIITSIVIIIESGDWLPSTVIYSYKLELFNFDVTILCIASGC